MDPLEFLRVADSLTNTLTPAEAEARTAISRYYYALFLSLRDRIGQKNAAFRAEALRFAEGQGSVHGLVERFLSGGGRELFGPQPRVPWFGQWHALRKNREKADYETDKPWDVNMQEEKKRIERLRSLVVQL